MLVSKIRCRQYEKLGNIVGFSKETTDLTEFPDNSFEYLEISGVSLGRNVYETTITSVEEAPSRAKMKTNVGDIAVSTTRPHRGAIVEIVSPNIIASTGFSIIREVRNDINKKWLLYVLLSNISLQQMLQRSSGGNYPAIIEDEIKRIIIPIIDTKKQKEMVAELEKVLFAISTKLQQADDLLAGLDEFVLQSLGLTVDANVNQMTYATNISSIQGRIDADYYSPRFAHFRIQIENSEFHTVSVEELCEKIMSGFAAGKQDQADDLPDDKRVPQLRPFSITPHGQLSFETQKYVPISRLQPKDFCKFGEVIFNNTNSAEWVGKTAVFDADRACATSNHITRITLKEGVNPYYIAAFFNMLRSMGYWKLLCTFFNNQAGVNTETLKSVRILLPPKDVQERIANEVHMRKQLAESLKTQAEQDWSKAKAKFEKELLGR